MKFENQLADRTRWHADPCSVAKVLDLLNTKTAFLVLRECFYGTSRFEDFVTRIGTSAPAASRALKHLEAAGIVRRVPYREPGTRSREAYELTSAGEDLLPVLLAMAQWGDDHLQGGTPPLAFVDADTGRPVRVRVTTDADLSDLRSDAIEVQATFSFD
ncbi:winged helix-turn-helix transcriptional regulator [Mycolicibacterium sp. GCM10028919]|uniref:winged helix-turn-helix transcriptional regulator n=1 Tax=Mycolicibacterium sp. GCM10028919 TaxID=3273401 RepID=UPI003617540F